MISKFIRAAFQMMLTRVGIKAVPAIARNPQGNSIIESIQKSIGNVLHTLIIIHKPQTKTMQKP